MPPAASSPCILLTLIALLVAHWPPASSAWAAELKRRHAIAKIGEPRFPPDYRHFDWVDPAARKGGSVRVSGIGSFDSLNINSVIGSPAPGLSLIDATLFAPSLDEPATAYALVAEWVAYPDDFAFATFRLRDGARFSDGTAITPEDVIFSFEEQTRASPPLAIFYRDVTKAELTAPREITFRFARPGNRDLPYVVSLLSIIPRHYWTAVGRSGTPRNLADATSEPPVGAGPYRIKSVDPGRAIVYERIPDWWGRDLPVNVGQYNFDEIRYTMYRDDIPEFEALKSGDIDLSEEFSSKRWATAYDIPPVRDGRLKRLTLARKTVANLQYFAFNTRRAKFADRRVRQALGLAYDFESANKSLFYGLYRRINSTFDNSELAHQGTPSGRELELLETVRDRVPKEVFGPAYRAPVNAGPDDVRRNLREAARLLDAAGWIVEGGVRRHRETRETLAIEFLSYDTSFDRIVLPYKQALERLGVRLDIRVVDATQYENRLKAFDFDMITDAQSMSHAPGNELREIWGSEAASKTASRNRIGVRDPAVDALIEEVIYARTRPELIAAVRALDRVILWNHYFVPQWFNPDAWIVHWDRFGRPARHPSQDPGVLTTWWIDPEADRRLQARRGRS
jgi:microcin C transport system substrate-binding protein